MAILRSGTSRDLPFAKALKRALTGDIITISRSPAGIAEGERFVHMLGVLSLIEGNLYLNNTFVCSNDVAETHGTFYPFYEHVLMYRKKYIEERTFHEFYQIRPTDPKKASKNTKIIPKPGFRFEADEIKITPLPSGKGLILVEQSPVKRILLIKMLKILGTRWNVISEKNVPLAWKGDHEIWTETPSSVVVGVEETPKDGMSITRFYRGHGQHRRAVHDHPGSAHKLEKWSTDYEFFYASRSDNQDVIVSATTAKPMYYGKGDMFVTSRALVRRIGTTVEANGVKVTDSFNAEWVVPHAEGLLYGWGGEIRMLVIKGTPE